MFAVRNSIGKFFGSVCAAGDIVHARKVCLGSRHWRGAEAAQKNAGRTGTNGNGNASRANGKKL